MTEHYLHVQESIRQSAIQLFSEAFSAWKLDGTTLIIASQPFKSLASALARISQQMILRSKNPTHPCDWPDKIVGIVVKIVVKNKWGQPTNKKIQRFLTWNRWIYGPSGENRTHGLLNPIQARYQNCATPGYRAPLPYRSVATRDIILRQHRFVNRFFDYFWFF